MKNIFRNTVINSIEPVEILNNVINLEINVINISS